MIPDELLEFASTYVPEPPEPPKPVHGFPNAPVVRQLFAVNRMPIKQLARLAGIHHESVRFYCTGVRDPSIHFFEYLAQAAGYSLKLVRKRNHAPRKKAPRG